MAAAAAWSKNATIEFIRDELRDEITFNRKQKRYTKLNKNRLELGESIDTDIYTEEFITSTAKSLKRKSLNVQQYRQLQNALLQSKNHINVFLKVDNAIQGLSRDLSSLSAQSKLAAANCCCNIALGNSKACVTLCKYIAPYLIAELESTSQPLAEVCLWTIGNLATGSSKAFLILHAQGCIKSLINLAQKSSDKLLPAVSYALLRYINRGGNDIELLDIVKIGEIIRLRYPKVSDPDTMWLLAILSSNSVCTNELIKCATTVFNFLSDTISTEDENIVKVSAALRIIGNIISEPSGQVAHYLIKEEIKGNHTFLNKLLCHQYVHIRKESLWLLGNLLNHPLDSIQETVKPIILSLSSLKLALNSFNEIT